MNIEQRMKRGVALSKADVFVRSDFIRYGSEAQVSRGIRSLIEQGRLVKLGVGIYAKTKKSVLSGKPIPVKPVGVLAPVALGKLGVRVYPSWQTRQYNLGQSTQIPAGNVINTGEQRISRKISFGNQFIAYENNNNATA